MGKSKFQISRSLDEKIRRIIAGSGEKDSEFASVPSGYILGFNYGNVTNCVGLTTNYQLHHAVFPVVGLAFFRNSPTDDDIKTNLRAIKHYSSSPNGLGSFKSDKNEHLFLIYSVDENTEQVDKRIFNFSKGTFVRRKSHRLTILNDPYCPRNVYNGSEDVFNLDDDDSAAGADDDQIDHLIFFIHGVGGVCDVRFRSCVEVVADFKKMANALLAQQSNTSSGASTPTTNRQLAQSFKKGFFRKQSTDSTTSRGSDLSDSSPLPPAPRARKVECLPISWHSLTRRQTGFSEQLSQVSLSSVPKLRQFLNKVVMDAMLYSTGPVYTQTILNNVGNEINRLYTLFMERHPNFTGSVSLAGHSLGSVIVFDLLAHQIPREHPQSHVGPTNGVAPTENSAHIDNINNNNGPPEAAFINTRQRCLNLSHNHRCVTVNDHRYCSDYMNLEELLKDMELSKYMELFQKEHIDLNSLLLLTDFDMKELQLPLGARRKLGTYINFKRASNIPMALSGQAKQRPQNHDSEQVASETSLDSDKVFCNPFCNMNTGQSLVEYPQLKFKPRCFFSFGSPTTMFLNVRGMQEMSSDYKLPTCDRMLNIFHPYDPLAYRFEPLIDPRFKDVEPVLIPHHRGGKRMHVQLREGFARVGHDIKHRLFGSLRNTWASFTRLGTAEVSSDSSLCHSISNEAKLSDESCPENVKRQRLSAGGPSSGERDSFETCSSHLSGVNSDPKFGQDSARNPLRRQNELRRSQSEIASCGEGGPSSLGSIIESSLNDSSSVDEELDPDAALLRRLRRFKFSPSTAAQGAGTGTSSANATSVDDYEVLSGKLPQSDEQLPGHDKLNFDGTKVGKLNDGRRIDYVLQEKPIELFNEYIFAFTSHANYWANEDSALIILKEIYQVDGVHLVERNDG